MTLETTLSASVIVDCPILEVFDFVADPEHLPEWVPLWSGITRGASKKGPAMRGERFTATLAVVPPSISALRALSDLNPFKVEVIADDVVPGRRIAWRSSVGWTSICDFESSRGRTILRTTHSLWSLPGVMMGFWLGPWKALGNEALHGILGALKRRLEGRAVEREPKIFFSYRRKASRHTGGRIYDALADEFGEGVVFRDVNSLIAGGFWKKNIDEALTNARVVVVHIGDQEWERTLVDRIADPNDYLLRELLLALEGSKVQIVPVMTEDEPGRNTEDRRRQIVETLAKAFPSDSKIHSVVSKDRQTLMMRDDPYFRTDLEQLLRAVWFEFRRDQP